MTTSKQKCLFAVNGTVPLLCGLFIYLTKSENTLVTSAFSPVRAFLPVISYPVVIRNFACDFLWAYAFFFCLRLSLGDELKGKHNLRIVVITAVFAVILELIQLPLPYFGTFDPLDIVAELLAVAVAFILTNLIERNGKRYGER